SQTRTRTQTQQTRQEARGIPCGNGRTESRTRIDRHADCLADGARTRSIPRQESSQQARQIQIHRTGRHFESHARKATPNWCLAKSLAFARDFFNLVTPTPSRISLYLQSAPFCRSKFSRSISDRPLLHGARQWPSSW